MPQLKGPPFGMLLSHPTVWNVQLEESRMTLSCIFKGSIQAEIRCVEETVQLLLIVAEEIG
jgi:hypothetical protein